MITVIIVIHLMLALAMIGVVLLQRSEGGGLGIGGGGGGGGGGMGGFLTGRGTANLLTRTTAILAACFMGTSILLTILTNQTREPTSILEGLPATAPGQAPQPSDQPTVPLQ